MIAFPPFCLDDGNECLLRGEQRIPLPPKLYALLKCLVEEPGRLVTKQRLMERLWPDTNVQPDLLKSYIRDLRKLLGDRAVKPRFIETIHSRGYRFIAPVGTQTGRAASSGEIREGEADSTQITGTAELDGMQSSFRAAAGGELQLVFVTGEIGIGKTTLCDAFERQLRETTPGVRIARGQCVQGVEAQEPYLPILEAVRGMLKGPERDVIAKVLAERAPSWFLRFPALQNHSLSNLARQAASGASTERMLRELSDAIEQIARDIPLVIIIDDAHWADPYTVEWIGYVAKQKRAARLMVIAAFRKTDLMLLNSRLNLLFHSLVARRICREIRVEPLSEAGIRDLLRAQSQSATIPEDIVRLLYEHSEGNPLFVLAVLDHLIDSKILVAGDNRWELAHPLEEETCIVPEAFRQMFEAHLELHCTEEEREVMEVASLCGISWTPDMVACLTDNDPERVEEICMRLARRNYALSPVRMGKAPSSECPRFRFDHSIYRQILQGRIGKVRRSRLDRLMHRSLELMCEERIEI